MQYFMKRLRMARAAFRYTDDFADALDLAWLHAQEDEVGARAMEDSGLEEEAVERMATFYGIQDEVSA